MSAQGLELGSATRPASSRLDVGSARGGGPGSSSWASPPPAPYPPQAVVPRFSPCPSPARESRSGWRRESRGGTGATIRRAERAEGLRERWRARAQQEPLRAARAGLSPGWEDRDTAARLSPATAPPLTNQIGPQQRPVRPRISLIGRRGSGGSSILPGGGASSARWGRESSRLPQQLRTRLSGPDGLRGSAGSGAGSRPGVSRPSWPQLPHLPSRVNALTK